MRARATWRGYSRRRRVALALALLLIAALAALWLLRKPLAGRFVDRTLAAAKVPARYTVADLGLGAQRLTNVVIGDPAKPDLVADWIETRTRITASGPELSGVRAGRLRLRGRLVEGRLSLGAIDRLLPKGDGGPFSLPKLDLSVQDGRMRLETPYGLAGVSLKGVGRLDNGFTGRLAVISERLGTGACVGERIAAAVRVRSAGPVTLDGPVNIGTMSCGGVRVSRLRSDLRARLLPGKDRGSTVEVVARSGPASRAAIRAQVLAATLRLVHEGRSAFTGRGELRASWASGWGVRAGGVALTGILRNEADGGFYVDGEAALTNADASRLVPRFGGTAAGTPLAPLVDRADRAIGAAARRFSGSGKVGVGVFAGRRFAIAANDIVLRSTSGAQVTFDSEHASSWTPGEIAGVGGTLTLAGGGLPSLRAYIEAGGRGNIPLGVWATMQPYEAGGARLALTPVTVAGDRIVTRVTLSGPLPDGRVDGLTVPLDLRLTRTGLLANPACTPVGFDRLALSGLVLRPARLQLCPTGGALVRVAGGRVSGGARLGATRLAGTLGTTPVALGLGGATLRLADRGFALQGVETRIGSPDRVTRLDFAQLEGRAGPNGIAGTFAGGAGQIADVPLLLSDAAGAWRFERRALTLTGALGVRDAESASPRFQPMEARGVDLSLVNGTIRATGALHEPTTGTRVATVAIRHALGPGSGEAALTVSDLTFAKGFQPELLTRLTFGVIADVAGTVSGEGRIAWSPQGVASTGTFRTAGTDLAAAFGPVTGIATEIRFTDLLALESAPDQVATVKSVNPGIAVTDGTIRFQLLPDTRVRVAGGEWPFAGGRLLLDPTLLDFGETAERRMTFRVDGIAADRFLQQFDFKNLDATGTFDGVLPMVFDQAGGRIENGRMAVREGGGTIRYVGAVTKEDVGFWGNLAFQALKSLRYRSLQLTMNGPLAGEMVTDVRFAGVAQGEGAASNILIRRLQRLPFVFNVRIKAPFRGLIDSAQSFYEPRRLIQRNLPQLIEEQNRRAGGTRVQPPASDPVPEKEPR